MNCPKFKGITKNTCLARQRLLRSEAKNVVQRTAKQRIKDCEGCEVGNELYEREGR